MRQGVTGKERGALHIPFREELRALTTALTLTPPRSPEPSKTSALGSGEDAIEPVSPPEGTAEPGHTRNAMYPLLYRDGEQAEPRYLQDPLQDVQGSARGMGPLLCNRGLTRAQYTGGGL